MLGYDITVLLGLFLGTILYGVLTVETVKRPDRLFHEQMFLILVLILTLFHGFQFIALLIKELFGSVATEYYSQIRYLSMYCLVFLPPVLVHVHAAFLAHVLELSGGIGHTIRRAPLLFYLPIILLVYFGQYTIIDSRYRILDESMSVIPAFVFYVILALVFSSILSVRIYRQSRNEKWRQFFLIETVIIFIIAGLLLYFYFFGGTGNVRLDKSIKHLLVLSSVIPTGVMIYLLFKYPFYSTVARRRFLLASMAGAFLSVYVVCVRALRKMGEENPEVNTALLEILLVCLLFVLYEPIKYLVRKVAGYYALNQRYLYQGAVRRMSERIAGAGNLRDLAKVVRASIVETMDVEEVGVFLISQQGNPNETSFSLSMSLGDIKPIDLSSILKNLSKSNGLYEVRRSNIFHLRSEEIPYQVYTSILLDNELVGVLALGRKKSNEEFPFEEKELLLTLASQIAIAIENIELMQRRIELEAKIYEADKLSSLGMLATSIAHEVKNPLSSIKSIVQSMAHEKAKAGADPVELQDLEIIKEEIDRLTGVVGQLLKYSKTDDRSVDQVDAVKIIGNIITILRQESRSKGITVFTRFDRSPLLMKVRQADLKEIIFNVIINAVQSMDNGGRLLVRADFEAIDEDVFASGTSTLTLHDRLYPDDVADGYEEWRMEPLVAKSIQKEGPAQQDGLDGEGAGKVTCLKLSITDSGQGIHPERLPDVFKPFFTTKPTGTGLGLAIVKNKVESLGGKLVVRSQLNVGTCFEMYIPAIASPQHV
ncbi:MAG: GAF domain-containing protein [Bacteroidetes bacterium]|nr:GAF domain-containing protein [Bacteroidota bacterium]